MRADALDADASRPDILGGRMTLPNPNQTLAHILATFRKHEARAVLNTPGGVLFPRDLAGIYRTVAGIHGVTVGTVKQIVMGVVNG